MKITKSITFQKLTSITTISSGVLSILSLVIGLYSVNFNFETLSDASALIASGADTANKIKWSYLLNMVGNYLLLLPLILLLKDWLIKKNKIYITLFTFSGLMYVLLGAIGSSIFAASWPSLIIAYQTASDTQKEILTSNMQLVTYIAGEGLHGSLQNIFGAVWFLGVGAMLNKYRKKISSSMLVLGAFLIINTIGNITTIEVLSMIGLSFTLLLSPFWLIYFGYRLYKDQ